MGRVYYSRKAHVEDLMKLDIAELKKWGYLTYSQSGKLTTEYPGRIVMVNISSVIYPTQSHIHFYYTQTDDYGKETQFDYPIYFIRTYPHLGGSRLWFYCPSCRRKARIVYKGREYFACRKCYNLAYRSQSYNRRAGWWGSAQYLEHDWKIDALWRKQKRSKYYRGRPTKRFQKLLRLAPEMAYQD
jgi:hypothetical protein